MKTLSFREAENSFETMLEIAVQEPVTIMREGRPSVVLIGAEEYCSTMETLHLLSTKTNAERLRRALVASRSA